MTIRRAGGAGGPGGGGACAGCAAAGAARSTIEAAAGAVGAVAAGAADAGTAATGDAATGAADGGVAGRLPGGTADAGRTGGCTTTAGRATTGELGKGVRGTTAAGGAGAFAAGRGDAGATVTGGRPLGCPALEAGRDAGAFRAATSACLRSRIAFRASPGLETCDRLNPCLLSPGGGRLLPPPLPRLPRVRCPRTFSASSSSMELECVFFSVTPTAVRASRMDLLFTSNSLARSFMRTLLIRSFIEFPRRLAGHSSPIRVRDRS